MKLLKQSRNGFQYQLSTEEAHTLRVLISHFPITPFAAVEISRTGTKAVEQEKLINESLAGHRDELKRQAGDLVSLSRFKPADDQQLYRVNFEEREMMLQILNDIRVDCWRLLGEPENLDTRVFEMPKEHIQHYHFMHLAGYFEAHFLNLEPADLKPQG